jgi:glycerophosphoryl diester phosphodiesterase
MTTAKRWPDPAGHPHAHRPRVAIAAVTTVAFLLVFLLVPDAAGGQAASPLGPLRAPGQAALVAGHRGDRDGAPENTLPAMRLAIASDVDFLETDLQLTSDGVPVLMHDWTLDRTTDGSGPVWASNWSEVSALDAGSWYSPEFAGTRVPNLDDLLDIVRPSPKRVILELKGSWNAAQLRGIAEEVYSHGLEDRVVVAGFDIMSLAALQAVAPDLQRVVITREVVGDPAILAATCGAVAIVTSRRFLEADPDAVTRIHDAGLGVLIYTLNSEQAWSEAIALGVDGIITDRPAELDRWLATGAG